MAAHQAPPSLEFPRQGYWSGLPFPSPMHACMLSRFSRVQLYATLWTVAHQAPLSTGFSRQEYWSGLPFPSRNTLGTDVQFLGVHELGSCDPGCILHGKLSNMLAELPKRCPAQKHDTWPNGTDDPDTLVARSPGQKGRDRQRLHPSREIPEPRTGLCLNQKLHSKGTTTAAIISLEPPHSPSLISCETG